jgi:hypothetical protein
LNITYEIDTTALCPNEPNPRNHYHVRIESATLIWTEKIEELADGFANTPISQEELTETFAAAFPGSTVTITGQHGRVRITSTRSEG